MSVVKVSAWLTVNDMTAAELKEECSTFELQQAIKAALHGGEMPFIFDAVEVDAEYVEPWITDERDSSHDSARLGRRES